MAIELDIEAIIEKVIKSGLDPAVFSKIDESDMKIAPNCLEWCIGKEFMNFTPYPRQIQMMIQLYEDYCPDCSDPRLVKDMHKEPLVEILDRVQLLEFGVCLKCKKNRGDFYDEGTFTYPYELDACVGQRFGKSLLVDMCSSYTYHKFTMLPSPSHYFGLLPNSPLIGTFTALDFQQATENLYDPFTALIDGSPWWQEYFSLLKYYGEKLGKELYKVKDTYMTIAHKNLTLYPKGPDKRRMRGRTRFLYGIDEIGWFTGDRGSIKMSADEINHALERSMTTIRQGCYYRRLELNDFDAPMAMAFNVSSPSHANDKIMRLVRQGNNDPTKATFHYPTWLAHPRITRKSLEPEFRRDPVAAERDYGANPPISNSPFISNEEAIRDCFGTNKQSKVAQIKLDAGKDKKGSANIYPIVKPVVSDKTTPFVLTCDAGHTNNSFGIVMSHWDDGHIFHDLLVECSPPEGSYVNFSKIYSEGMNPLFNNFNIALFAADRWQGLKLLHDAGEDHGCIFEQYSLTWADMDEYRNAIYDKTIHYPKPEDSIDKLFNSSTDFTELVYGKPVLHSALQLLTVQESGKQVVKGEGLTDDLWRACALGAALILEEDKKGRPVRPYLRTKGGKMKTNRALGSVRMISQGSGGGATGGSTSKIGGVRRKTM